MRRLKDVRDLNKRKDLLFIGMENKPKNVTTDFYNEQIEIYKNIVKPNVKKMMSKYNN